MSYKNRYTDITGSDLGIGTLPVLRIPTKTELAITEQLGEDIGRVNVGGLETLDPGTLSGFTSDYKNILDSLYDKPKQRTTKEIASELANITGYDSKQSRDLSIASALSKFGQAIGQTPGMSTLQGFTAALPAFTESMLSSAEKNRNKRTQLMLSARSESKQLEKEARDQANTIAAGAVSQYQTKQATYLKNIADAMRQGRETAQDLTKGAFQVKDYDVVSAYDNNADGFNLIDSKTTMYVDKRNGNQYVEIGGNFYTKAQTEKYGFDFVIDKNDALGKNTLQNMDRDQVQAILNKGKDVNVTTLDSNKNPVERVLKEYKGTFYQVENGVLSIANRDNFALGKLSENVKKNTALSDQFVSIFDVVQPIGELGPNNPMYKFNVKALPYQRTREDGSKNPNVLQPDGLFVVPAQDQTEVNILSTNPDQRAFALDKAKQNQELKELIIEIAGNPKNFEDYNPNIYGFENVFNRSSLMKGMNFVGGLVGSDYFNYELSAQGKLKVQALSRKIAQAWATNPRYAIAERSALLGIADNQSETEEQRIEQINSYFNTEGISMAVLLEIGAQTDANLEGWGAYFRPKEDGRYISQVIPSGGRNNPFVLDGEAFKDANGEIQFRGNSKLDDDTNTYLNMLEDRAIESGDPNTIKDSNNKKIRISGQLYKSIAKAKGIRVGRVKKEGIVLTHAEFNDLISGNR